MTVYYHENIALKLSRHADNVQGGGGASPPVQEILYPRLYTTIDIYHHRQCAIAIDYPS